MDMKVNLLKFHCHSYRSDDQGNDSRVAKEDVASPLINRERAKTVHAREKINKNKTGERHHNGRGAHVWTNTIGQTISPIQTKGSKYIPMIRWNVDKNWIRADMGAGWISSDHGLQWWWMRITWVNEWSRKKNWQRRWPSCKSPTVSVSDDSVYSPCSTTVQLQAAPVQPFRYRDSIQKTAQYWWTHWDWNQR